MAKPARPCAKCGRNLPRKAHANRKFCEQCRPARRPKPDEPAPVGDVLQLVLRDGAGTLDIDAARAIADAGKGGDHIGPISAATEIAIDAADYLTDKDRGAIQTLRYLAKKIDTEDQLRDKILQAQTEAGERPPPFDNTSIPTYLNLSNALGLTPAGRKSLPAVQGPASSKKSKLSALRDNAKAAG